MDKTHHHNKFLKLRKAYPYFVFQSYSIFRTKTHLQAKFLFSLAGKYTFQPEIEIPFRDFYDIERLSDKVIENIIFHIGMVELISYWKAACPPKVIVLAGRLDEKQTAWWKKLYFHGLGEFFYLNDVTTDMESFMEIIPGGKAGEISTVSLNSRQALVPVGGGKDSVVSLELLKNSEFNVIPFLLNPREAGLRSINIAGFSKKEAIVVNRTLDPELLKLNEAGFLNGHTPFSALLAFVSAFTALLSGAGNIALSNESSANQSTVPGSKINHQYSKSFEFEQDFNWYLKHYIHPELRYFSFLRPLDELQIAYLFSGFPQHHFSFRSCNAGSKTDSWCGQCPKCLFTYVILSPFLPQEKLEKIFGKNLLKDENLVPVMEELNGKAAVKPFECVGTPEEVNAALWKSVEIKNVDNQFPLVKMAGNAKNRQNEQAFKSLLTRLNREHLLPKNFFHIIKHAIADAAV
ncbi:MAG: hypothetical protein IEMM0006_0908 [bacterium]|nr:MAG: hypothetical protein IEMM0006_0908 [bacterium]